MKETLRQYISLVLEAIHQERSEGTTSSKFLFNEFKQLKDQNEKVQYAKQRLKLLGEGSSRITFIFTNRHVLKIATNKAGFAQNMAELDVATNPNMKPVIAELKDYDPNGSWLVEEMVREVDDQEFEDLSGVPYVFFTQIIQSHVNASPSAQKRLISRLDPKGQQWIKNVIHMIETGNLIEADFLKVEHWGKTGSGRLVIMDYGYTEDVFNRHYDSGTVAPTQIAATEKAPISQQPTRNIQK